MAQTFRETFLAALATLATHHGSQRQAALALGLSSQRWGQWLAGKHEPKADLMEQIIDAAERIRGPDPPRKTKAKK